MSEKNIEKEVSGFDLDELNSLDEARMRVAVNGKLTDWEWIFAGPGHEKTIAQANRLAKERLKKDAEIEMARVNGRKWKPDVEDPEDLVARNTKIIVDRLLGWTPIQMGGKDFPFSPENARMLLTDRRKQQLLFQALEFLGEESSFSQRDATS